VASTEKTVRSNTTKRSKGDVVVKGGR
jgi:hypothetical protein